MINSIYLSRKNKIILEPGTNHLDNAYLLNLLKNIESLGYTLSAELLEVIQTLSFDDLKIFYDQLVKDIKNNVGFWVRFEPMYPNFPDQVKYTSEKELYGNAFMHYLGDWIGLRIMPNYIPVKRAKLEDNVKLKVIALGSEEDFDSIFLNLLRSKIAISDSDKSDLRWFIGHRGEGIKKLLPEHIPSKENLAFLMASMLINNIDTTELLSLHVKTATDVLRIVTGMSLGDISLAENTRFSNISKRNRKIILQCLENCGNITEDMLRNKNRWKRLGERLHPFEYKHKFPACFHAFDIIRNDKPFETFNSKVEKMLVAKEIREVTDFLKSRPGELARRLDKLLRDTDEATGILSSFREVAEKVSSPVLLQVHSHFKHRNSASDLRVFFPMGNVGKARAIDNNMPFINEHTCKAIVSICEAALINRFKKYLPLGKVFIEEKLKNYTVPFGIRSASKSLKTIARGSRIELPDGNTIRFFIYWKDGNGRTDIDLSAVALDKESMMVTTIAYYNLKEFGGYHSGDITSAPEGASEFIDIEISRFTARGIRYLQMSLFAYTNQRYCDLPVCFAGFMMRQYPQSGEIFEPSTVENKFDLSANSRIAIPIIIDLEERTVIWTDISLKGDAVSNNNVHNNLSSLTIINRAMTSIQKTSLYELFSLHAQARGERTFEIKEANTIFAVDKGIRPTDTDIIVSNYL